MDKGIINKRILAGQHKGRHFIFSWKLEAWNWPKDKDPYFLSCRFTLFLMVLSPGVSIVWISFGITGLGLWHWHENDSISFWCNWPMQFVRISIMDNYCYHEKWCGTLFQQNTSCSMLACAVWGCVWIIIVFPVLEKDSGTSNADLQGI